MKLISIDVGIKNLSIAIIVKTKDEWKLRYWFVMNLLEIEEGKPKCQQNSKKVSKTVLAKKLKEKFDALSFMQDPDVVIIENQMSRIMTIVQGLIIMYYTMLGVKSIKCIHAKHKLKIAGGAPKGKKNYGLRKEKGIEITRVVLEENFGKDNKYLKFFETNNKKDDLADCFLQAMYYLGVKMNGSIPEPLEEDDEEDIAEE